MRHPFWTYHDTNENGDYRESDADPANDPEVQARVLRAAAQDVYDDACHERILKLADRIALGEVEITVEEPKP